MSPIAPAYLHSDTSELKQRGATIRVAVRADEAQLRTLIHASADALQAPFLSADQITASFAFMGLDTQLIEDGTYLVAQLAGEIVGCGGWSRRATLYGGDDSVIAREPALLDPRSDAAKIRAMYTRPQNARQGVGSLVLRACEEAALAAGFRRVELMSTLSGEPLYINAGYVGVERVEVGAACIPFVRMSKRLAAPADRSTSAVSPAQDPGLPELPTP